MENVMVSRTLTNTNLSSNFSCIIEMARIAEKYPQGRFILRTSTNADAEAFCPIYLYYCCCGKKIRYNTGIRTKIKDWNENDGKLRASYGENYKKNNQILTKMVAKINNQIIDYVTLNGAISPDIIKAFTNGDDKPLRADKGQSFVTYALDLLLDQYTRKKIRISTYKNSVTIINQFKKCMDEMGNDKNNEIFVGDMTEDIVRDFIAWGLRQGRKTSTIEKYKELISKVCRHASDKGLLSMASAVAIADIIIEEYLDDDVNRSIKYLTIEELSKLVCLDRNLINKKQSNVLDMFQFALYSCGLRVSDVLTLRWSDIDFEKKEIFKIQVKTRGRNYIPLTDGALKILRKWKGRHNIFVFGLLPDDFKLRDEERLRTRRNSITSTINKQLENISKKAQLSKKVTFHMARHSWAVAALEQGMQMSMISSLLGHKNSAITEKVYAEFRQETKAEAVCNMKFDYIIENHLSLT